MPESKNDSPDLAAAVEAARKVRAQFAALYAANCDKNEYLQICSQLANAIQMAENLSRV